MLDLQPFVKERGFHYILDKRGSNFDFLNRQILQTMWRAKLCRNFINKIHNQHCVPIGNLTLLLKSVASSRLGTVTIIQPRFVTCSRRIFQVLKNKVNGFLWMKITIIGCIISN